ncbi:MAG: hypothetical protein ACRELS_08195 [Candidatus Rokuibacteriota bacterium]
MASASAPFAKVEDCDLCRAKKLTPWYHEDDVCWVAECDVCDTPMVVWRWHGTAPPPEHVAHMRARLKEVALAHFGECWVDDHMRNIPDHWHAHGRPADGFWGWEFKRPIRP